MSEQHRTRLILAVVTTLVVGAASYFAVGIGMNVYLDDYCATAMELPPEAENWTGISGQRFANPVTIECRFDDVGWVQQTDPRPLLYTIGLLGLVVATAALLGAWVHRAGIRHRTAARKPTGSGRR